MYGKRLAQYEATVFTNNVQGFDMVRKRKPSNLIAKATGPIQVLHMFPLAGSG